MDQRYHRPHHHHHHQQQQLTGTNVVDSSYMGVIIIKCINVILTMTAVFFIIVSTLSHLLTHLTATR